jgi:hypothetical protein
MTMMTLLHQRATHGILRTLHIAVRLCDNGFVVWLAAEDLEMAGLIKRKVWDRVLRSTLLPSDTIFQTRFHYKIKRKSDKFEKCKVRLLKTPLTATSLSGFSTA